VTSKVRASVQTAASAHSQMFENKGREAGQNVDRPGFRMPPTSSSSAWVNEPSWTASLGGMSLPISGNPADVDH